MANMIDMIRAIALLAKQTPAASITVKPAGNRYGVRYEELLAFIISAI